MKSRKEINGLNYSDIISNDMYRFRRMGLNMDDPFYYMDQPGAFYFKIFFKFDDGNDANGLLGLPGINFDTYITESTQLIPQNLTAHDARDAKYSIPSTAYYYLVNNNELKRANMLKDFILLLSDINTYSPWYFKSISGLEAALERKMFDKEFKIEEEEPKISIKCMPDATDTRIGTLLDLYRAICYDYEYKREVLPDNLRQFDMYIYIFHTPIARLHKVSSPQSLIGSFVDSYDDLPTANAYLGLPQDDPNKYYTSNKMIELRNCQFDLNSSKSVLGELNNEEPFQMEYTIDITAADVYEYRYNETFGYAFGDYIMSSIINEGQSYKDSGNLKANPEAFKSRMGVGNTFLDKIADNTIAYAKNNTLGAAVTKVNSLALGNLSTASIDSVTQAVTNPAAAIAGAVGKSRNINEDNMPSNTIGGSIGGSSQGTSDGQQKLGRLPGYEQAPGAGMTKVQKLKELNNGKKLFNSL